MSDFQRDRLDQDEDRLPWLEPVDDYEEEEGISIGRLIGAVVVGLVALGLVIGGIFWLRNRDATGDGTLIAAPEGPIKERPGQPGGMEVEGTGDVAYDASVGKDVNSTIDLTAIPEAPITQGAHAATNAPVRTAELPASKVPAAPAPAAQPPKPQIAQAPKPQVAQAPKPPVATAPVPGKPAPVPAPAKPAPAPKNILPEAIAAAPASGGGAVQLGAFSSSAQANKAWGSLSSRFGFLSGLSHNVADVTVGGKTLYRLRASAGGQAGSICAKLKVAGEACSVVN